MTAAFETDTQGPSWRIVCESVNIHRFFNLYLATLNKGTLVCFSQGRPPPNLPWVSDRDVRHLPHFVTAWVLVPISQLWIDDGRTKLFDKSSNTGICHLINATRFSMHDLKSAFVHESAFR